MGSTLPAQSTFDAQAGALRGGAPPCVVSVRRETAPIEASASPRKPSVEM